MKIIIKATNFKLTPSIDEWVARKIGSLDKFIKRLDEKGAAECRVEVGKTTKHHQKGPFFRAETDIRLLGKILRAEASAEDLRTAVNKLKDELQLQIKEYKEKMAAKLKRGARIGNKMIKLDPAALTEGEIDVSRRHLEE